MSEQRIPIEPNVQLIIHAHKHADLVSHTAQDILVTGRGAMGATVEARPAENALHLEMFKEGAIGIPVETPVVLQTIGGHCKVNDLPQGVTGAHIGGHLTVQNAGPVQLAHVGGHAKLRQVTGDLQLAHVGGHLKVNFCTGSVAAAQVGGHAELVEVSGGCDLDKVGGHAKLIRVSGGQRVEAGGHVRTRIDPLPDLPYDLKAGGVLACDLPATANATIHMQGPATGPHFNPTRTMGAGTAQIRLQAGGPITLTEDSERKGDDLKRGIRQTVRAAQDLAKSKAKAVLEENNITPETTAGLQEQFTEIAGEAVEVFKDISEEVQEKARQVWKPETPSRAGSTGTTPPPATAEEERKMILRMLAENKITVDEASDLLRALNA